MQDVLWIFMMNSAGHTRVEHGHSTAVEHSTERPKQLYAKAHCRHTLAQHSVQENTVRNIPRNCTPISWGCTLEMNRGKAQQENTEWIILRNRTFIFQGCTQERNIGTAQQENTAQNVMRNCASTSWGRKLEENTATAQQNTMQNILWISLSSSAACTHEWNTYKASTAGEYHARHHWDFYTNLWSLCASEERLPSPNLTTAKSPAREHHAGHSWDCHISGTVTDSS